MNDWLWIVLAWVLFGLAVWMVIARQRRNGSRHFPYEPRAALLKEAIERQVPVSFVYWSQVEERWLRRHLVPVSLSSGHLRASDRKTGQSRRYEVTRMRLVRVDGRQVSPPWRWQVPLAAVMGLIAAGLSAYALRQRFREQATATSNTETASTLWWRNAATSTVARLVLNPEPLVADNLEVLPEPSTITTTASSNAIAPAQTNAAAAPAAATTWTVFLEDDKTKSSRAVAGALQQVFLFARTQAIYLSRQAEINGRWPLWQGSQESATNYLAQLQKLGLRASAAPTAGSP